MVCAPWRRLALFSTMADQQEARGGDAPVRIASKDPLALADLLVRHVPGLRTFLRLRMSPTLRRHEQSSDLVQTVCREVLEHADGFEYRSEPEFRAYLWVTALNKVRDRVRFLEADKRDVRREAVGSEVRDLDQLERESGTPSGEAMERERAAMLEAAFDRLPEDYREIITLSRLCGLSHAELASKLGKSEVALRSLLHRALARLSTLIVIRGDDHGL